MVNGCLGNHQLTVFASYQNNPRNLSADSLCPVFLMFLECLIAYLSIGGLLETDSHDRR